MNFSLELETQKNNELLAYLHQPILELSDSLRAVSHYSELENSFVKLKDYHTRRMNDLERRLEECIAFHQQTDISVDISRSRINEDRQSMSIERYQDLLECNFKEIEWVTTSRVFENTEEKRENSLQKMSCEIQRLSEEVQNTSNKFSEELNSLAEQSEKTTEDLGRIITEIRGQTRQRIVGLQQQISQCHKFLSGQFQGIEEKIEGGGRHLADLVQKNISSLSAEVSQLISH